MFLKRRDRIIIFRLLHFLPNSAAISRFKMAFDQDLSEKRDKMDTTDLHRNKTIIIVLVNAVLTLILIGFVTEQGLECNQLQKDVRLLQESVNALSQQHLKEGNTFHVNKILDAEV